MPHDDGFTIIASAYGYCIQLPLVTKYENSFSFGLSPNLKFQQYDLVFYLLTLLWSPLSSCNSSPWVCLANVIMSLNSTFTDRLWGLASLPRVTCTGPALLSCYTCFEDSSGN